MGLSEALFYCPEELEPVRGIETELEVQPQGRTIIWPL
jgi:hypothetical protein